MKRKRKYNKIGKMENHKKAIFQADYPIQKYIIDSYNLISDRSE